MAVAKTTIAADHPAITIAGLAVLLGSMGLVVRQVELPSVAITWSRAVFAIPALAIVAVRRSDGRAWRWRPGRGVLLNGVVLSLHWTALVAALQRAPIGTVLLITYLSPVGIAIAASRFLGERITSRVVIALGLSVAGVTGLALPSLDGASATGVLLAVLTGAIYVVLAILNKQLVGQVGGAALALWQVLIATVVLAPFAALSDWGSPELSWLWLPVLGVVFTAVFFGACLLALEHIDATRAAVLLYLEPATAVVLGWLVLGEALTPSTVLGGIAILGGGILVLRSGSPLDPDAT